eukprot:scaffold46368_cov37-Phaeocystis_antarctica.AAC.5
MLAVMARLQQKLGNDARCDELQRRVLSMRHEALGATHEDTHRSAMDVHLAALTPPLNPKPDPNPIPHPPPIPHP